MDNIKSSVYAGYNGLPLLNNQKYDIYIYNQRYYFAERM